MKRLFPCLFLLALPVMAEAPSPCPVDVFLRSWRISAYDTTVTPGARDSEDHRKKGIYLSLMVRVTAPACLKKINTENGELYLEDSTGARSPKLNITKGFSSSRGIIRVKEVNVSSTEWFPSAKATKMWLKGKIYQPIGTEMSSSGIVKIPLKEGASVPVTLKNAGLNGIDVQAKLSVDKYALKPSLLAEKKYNLELRLTYDEHPVMAYELSMGTADGKLFPARPFTTVTAERYKNFVYELDAAQHVPEITVSVHHATGVKMIEVPVNIPFGWMPPENAAPKKRKVEQ